MEGSRVCGLNQGQTRARSHFKLRSQYHDQQLDGNFMYVDYSSLPCYTALENYIK